MMMIITVIILSRILPYSQLLFCALVWFFFCLKSSQFVEFLIFLKFLYLIFCLMVCDLQFS